MVISTIVAQENQIGTGYLNCGTSGLKKGCFVKLDGVFTVDSGPSGLAGAPGYAKAGSLRWSPLTSGTLVDNGNIVGILDKKEYQLETSDLNLDTVVSGEGIIVYTQGYVHTDQYDATQITSSLAIGTPLYVNANSVLCTGGLINAIPRAVYFGMASGYDSNYMERALIYVNLLEPLYTKKSDSL